MGNELAISSSGFKIEDGPFTAPERELLQRSIEDWLRKNTIMSVGFDIAVCAWQSDDKDLEILAAGCQISEESTPADLHEFRVRKEAIRTALFAHAISVPGESDVYCLRMNDEYRSQPLVLILNADGGRFFVSLATWFNYVSVGRIMRFLQFTGNLLCQMRMSDRKLADSFARAFGLTRFAPQGQGETPMFCPSLPEFPELLPARKPEE